MIRLRFTKVIIEARCSCRLISFKMRTEIRSKNVRRRQKPVREKINLEVDEYWTREDVSDG